MASNELLAFAVQSNANLEGLNQYKASDILKLGFESGRVSSALMNRVLRQATFSGAMCGEFIIEQLGEDVVDNGDVDTLLDQFVRAIEQFCKTLFQRPDYSYTTVTEMVADSTLQEGVNAHTVGYYNIMDGGGTQYETGESADSDYSIKLDNGLFANPQLGDTINLRQFGLQDGDDLYTTLAYLPGFPGCTFQIPAGSYVWESTNRTIFTPRGTYRIEALGEVKISAYDATDSDNYEYLRIGPAVLGSSDAYILMNDYTVYGKNLTSETTIGSKEFTFDSLPNGLEVGDTVHLRVTRGSEGECRGINSEGQTSVIDEINGNTITLRDAALFDYSVNSSYVTGSVTKNTTLASSTYSSDSYTYVYVDFDDTDVEIASDNRNLLGLCIFSTTDSNGDPVSMYPEYYYANDKCFVFYWHRPAAAPQEGDTFKISLTSAALFRPKVELSIQGNIKFDCDTSKCTDEHNETGDSMLHVYGINNPEFEGVNFSRFGRTCLAIEGCYEGWQRDTVYDGNYKQSGTFDSHGFSLGSGNTRFNSFNVDVYSYGQGINAGNTPIPSIDCKFNVYNYIGGGQNYDGTPIWPWSKEYEQDDSSDTTFTSNAVCSHGGSYNTEWNDVTIRDCSNPFNMRGKQEDINHVRMYGAIGSSQVMHFAGITLKDVKYYPASNNNTVDYSDPRQSIVGNFMLLNMGMGNYALPQYYPSEFSDIYMDKSYGAILYANGRGSTFQNFTWGNLVIGKAVNPDYDESTGTVSNRVGPFVTYVGNGTTNLRHCFNKGGNLIIDLSEADTFQYVFNENWVYLTPTEGSYYWIGNSTLIANIGYEKAVNIPLRRARDSRVFFNMHHYLHSDYSIYGVILGDGSTHVRSSDPKGGADSYLAASTTRLDGTTGDSGKMTFYYRDQVNGIPMLQIENRLDSRTTFAFDFS